MVAPSKHGLAPESGPKPSCAPELAKRHKTRMGKARPLRRPVQATWPQGTTSDTHSEDQMLNSLGRSSVRFLMDNKTIWRSAPATPKLHGRFEPQQL